MRNGFNQFSIPYMNELTANQLGAASQFGGNMPIGFINYSLDQVASWFATPQDRIRDTREWERIIRGLPGQGPAAPIPRTPPTFPVDPQQGLPPITPTSPGVPHLPAPGAPGGDVRDRMGAGQGIGAGCGFFDLECWLQSPALKDAGKRIGLVLLGGALLIIAIISLR